MARGRSRTARGSGAAAQLLERLVADPSHCGIGRLAMRTPSVPLDLADVASTEPEDSPWRLCLDGEWSFRLLDRPAELTDEMVAAGPADAGWATTPVPGAWTMQRRDDGQRLVAPHYTNVVMPFDADPPAVPGDNPTGVHRRTVAVPAEWSGRRVVLRVGAAESLLAVWVDGRFVGSGTDSRLPNEFDLTEVARPGRRVVLTLVVCRWSAHTWLEDQDQWWHGGIQRSVTLYSTAAAHVADVSALPGLVGPDTGTLDLTVRLDGPLRREPGWTVEVLVRGRVGRPRRRPLSSTGRLPVPAWDASSEAAQLISAMFVEPAVVRARLEVARVRPWCHEDPARYRVEVHLRAPDGELVEAVRLHTGFRSVEVADNELRINGEPVLLHGVNLHEHDPRRGRVVDEELTRRDLVLMKAHNLNAVRAAHYPHDEHLAELCDELGLYLVDEANVESHGRQASLCHDPTYAAAILERVQRMVLRDDQHPSIILWSLGNEAGDGAAHAAAAAWVRRHDPTRPLHYEGPLMHDLGAAAPVTDVVCPMYASVADIVEWSRSGRDPRRPLILCEYSHAMGNSNGSLADYWAAFEEHHGLQGGFIWEWLEHGIDDPAAGLGPGGRVSWRYGGDFGDQPNDANFVCDGLVSADREPHPAMAEVHWLGRPVRVRWADDAQRRLRVENRRWFSGLDDLRGEWELSVDGQVVSSGELDVGEVAPRASTAVGRPFRVPALPAGSECHLDLRWRTRRRTPWAPAGHVVAHDQVPVAARTARRGERADRGGRADRDGGADRDRRSAQRTVASSGEQATVRPLHGQAQVHQLEWRPTIFRALTDNDGLRQGWMREHLGQQPRWVDRLGLDRTDWRPDPPRERRSGTSVVHTTSGELVPASAAPAQVRRRVELRDDGWSRVGIEIVLPAALDDPPRVGTEWCLPGSLDRVEWFGDGPHECYPDRRASATRGRWATTVEQNYVDYVVPQEHGHRTAVRWLTVAGSQRAPALLVVADPAMADGFGMAVRQHSDHELWSCTHTDELERLASARGPATFLYLDAAQRGLGTASCGPDALERFRVRSGRHRLEVWMRWIDPRSDDPGELARRVRAQAPSTVG